MRNTSAIVMAMTFAACGLLPSPNPVPSPPSPSPTPPAHDPVCTPGHGDPGEHYGCWAQPPGGEWMYVCPIYDAAGNVVGTQNEASPDLCPAAPSPPASDPCYPALDQAKVSPFDDPESNWTKIEVGERLSVQVQAAQNAAQAACPSFFTVKHGATCLAAGPAGIDAAYNLIAAHIQAQGLLGSQAHTSWGELKDNLTVNVPGTDAWEAWHLFEYGGGCMGHRFDGVWTYSGGGGPSPLPTPPAPSPEPSPYAGPSPVGLPAHFVIKPHNNLVDTTYVIDDRTYCDATGQTGRLQCPIRAEGQDVEEKDYWQALVVGDQRWWCDGVEIHHTDNPAQAKCAGHAKTCTADGKTCSECDWPNTCR